MSQMTLFFSYFVYLQYLMYADLTKFGESQLFGTVVKRLSFTLHTIWKLFPFSVKDVLYNSMLTQRLDKSQVSHFHTAVAETEHLHVHAADRQSSHL